VKQLLLWIGGFGLFLVALAGGWVLTHMEDVPGVEDQDLEIPRLQILENQNAFTYFQPAVNALDWPKDQKDPRLRANYLDEAWDRSFAVHLIAKNSKVFRLVDLGLAAPQFQLPEYGLNDPYQEDLFTMMKVGRLLHLRAQVRMQDGNHLGALADFLRAVELGHQIEGARGAVLINLMIGTGIKRNALKEIYQSTKHLKVGVEKTRIFTSTLERYRTDPDAWARMAAGEYQIEKRIILDAFKRKEQQPLTWSEWVQEVGKELEWSDWYAVFLPDAYSFQPNRTLGLGAGYFRTYGREGAQPCSEIDQPSTLTPLGGLGSFMTALGPNGAGVTIHDMSKTNFYQYHVRRCLEDTRLSATQVMSGLKAFKDHKGHLPNTLEELVPQYLEAVPLDRFDGRPIRYSKESQMVYSVGDDFVDSGGVALNKAREHAEPSWPILF